MKKLLSLLFALLLFVLAAPAAEKTLHLKFDKNQFSYHVDSCNLLTITVPNSCYMVTYDNNLNEPGLPLFSVDVKMPKGHIYKNHIVSFEKNVIFDNVLLSTNPISIPTSQYSSVEPTSASISYTKQKYPSAFVKYIMTTVVEDSAIFHFQVCPFEYDASTKKLCLINKIEISVLTNVSDRIKDSNQNDFLDFCVKNNIDYINRPIVQSYSNCKDSIDYIIITSRELSYYFDQLVQWKTTKGVRTIVTTIEDIDALDKNSGRSMADKIKAYLLTMYHIKGYRFKYLLLGGDDTIVPSKKCYGKVEYTKFNNDTKKIDTIRYLSSIPADIYYACLDYSNDPFWDNSKNDVYGELEDSISLSQNIFVTRLPVRTSTDVKTTLKKIIGYEQYPSLNGWNNSILMSGSKLGDVFSDGHSDAEIKGDCIYKNSIARYWAGERKRLYDTFSDFENEGISSLTRDNFLNVMSQGFAFVDMMTHGSDASWSMPNGSFTTSYAENTQSPQYSVITTIACNTNAFDRTEPCLSEAFIRNPDNGVIAYLGSSRYGWYTRGRYSLGTSANYEQAFYKTLFNKNIGDKNFGKVVAYAKNSMVSACNAYNPERWVQFSLNPIGDAEMPLYTAEPIKFDKCRITKSTNAIYLDTGIDSCNVCIMSSDDLGETYYMVLKNVRSLSVPKINTNLRICITKQDYVPYVYNIKYSVAPKSSKLLSGFIDDSANKIMINAQLVNTSAYIVVSDINGYKEREYNVFSEESSVVDDASGLKKGVHIVSLFEDGKITDSMQIIR